MRDFFNKKNKTALLIVAIAILIVIVSIISLSFSSGNSDVTSNAFNIISKPVKSSLSSMVEMLEQVYGYMYQYDQIVEDNEKLRSNVAELEKEYREYTEISKENERLRKLLGLSERNSDFEYETATIISWSASSWSSSCTINKGSSSGLELNDCIITEDGYLVGQITEINPSTSTVTTILDSSSSVGALISKSSAAVIAQGDFALFEQGLLKLAFLPDDIDLISGDTIVTSGRGGAFPQGLVIGDITDVVSSESGLEDYAVIEPAVNFDNLSHVFVITYFDVTE